MKKFILRNKLLWIFSIITLTAQAQVCINIQNPANNTALHLKGDPTKTTSNADELVITTEGNIGVGTLTPTAKLEIIKNGTNSPLRLSGGNSPSKANQIITSNDAGYTYWKDMPTTGGANYYITGAKRSFANGSYILVKSIPVSIAGTYQITLRWWGKATTFNANYSTAAIFYLAVGTTASDTWSVDLTNVKDSSEEYVFGKNGDTFCFGKSFTAEATANSHLKLYIRVSNGGPWTIGDVDIWNTNWNPSIALFRI